MIVTGTTRLVFLIGSPIAQSKSPAMHNAAFAATGEDLVYVAFEIGLDRAANAIAALRTLNARGGNVTMPLKQAAVRLVDRLTPVARLVGAVNTIVNDEGVLTGTTPTARVTYEGWTTPAFSTSAEVHIVGAGGAAAAVAVQAAVRALARSQSSIIAISSSRTRNGWPLNFATDSGVTCRAHDLADEAVLRREIASSDIF